MIESVERLPAIGVVGPVPELEPQEIARVRRSTAAQLNCENRSKVG